MNETIRRLARTMFKGLVWVLGIAIALMTFLPLWDTNTWWVRALDFPRLQIAVGAGVVFLAAFFLPGASRIAVLVLMLGAGGYQLWRILPYTSLYATEMTLAPAGPGDIRLMSSNVLMENDRYDLLIGEIERFDPDVVLLMETGRDWVKALEPVLARYTTVVREPRENHYGMVFATRLKVKDARIIYLTEGDTPTLLAEMTGPHGAAFRFVGLHPRPPVPGQSTEERDAQIHYAARFASKADMPLISMGDFNDVAWSDTSQMFKHVGQYLDPRIGRGFFASFDAETPYIRFPIDQLYVTEDVVVVSIDRLPFIGSDHFPMVATIRLDAELASRLNMSPEPLDDDERAEIDASVDRMRLSLGHEMPQ